MSGAATIYGLQVKGIWEGFKAMCKHLIYIRCFIK